MPLRDIRMGPLHRPPTAPPAAATAPPAPGAPPPAGPAAVRWYTAAVLLVAFGWGLNLWAYLYARKHELPVGPIVAGSVVVSFLLFLLVERLLPLGRFLRYPRFTLDVPWQAALFDTALGVPGLYLRAYLSRPKPQKGEKKKKDKSHPLDLAREVIETVVFVVVLVFLLKQFVVEAFVIPTGSMAETLYGYQKQVVCDDCRFRFPLNASVEADPQEGQALRPVEGYCCPNCFRRARFLLPGRDGRPVGDVPAPEYESGDRVLVHKPVYHLDDPRVGDVVVFKFPERPQRDHSAQNYIKRLCGVGGQTVGIHRGELFHTTRLTYPENRHPRPDDPADLWKYTFKNDASQKLAPEALELFAASEQAGFGTPDGFALYRKPDDVLLAEMKIVYHNDYQSATLARQGVTPRWRPEGSGETWAADDPKTPRAFTHSGPNLTWVRYRHPAADRWDDTAFRQAGPVRNFLGYNAEVSHHDPSQFKGMGSHLDNHRFWVGDLILECRARFDDPAARVVLELSKGENRYQAEFAGGQVRLLRTGPGGKELAVRPTPITGVGAYRLRFANVDCRLRVWVNDDRIDFGTDADYPLADPQAFDPADTKQEGWTTANDVAAPASVGAVGAVELSKLAIYRDTYYISDDYSQTSDVCGSPPHTFYVQPGHYLCLGDNSAQSSDSRYWGLVPDRLMLGKAMFVFFPRARVGFIK